MIVQTLMKCCVQVKEPKHFNIFLPGWGFIPCLNHIPVKDTLGTSFSTEAMRGA